MRITRMSLAAAASLFAASSAFAQSPTVSPWTKFCGAPNDSIERLCLTVSDVRRAPDRLVAGVALVEKAGRKTLRVSLPAGREVLRGVRVTIGKARLRNGRVSCERAVCMADFAVNPQLIATMKRARSIEVRARTRHTLPLAGFAAAFDNPPTVTAQALREQVGLKRIRCAAASDLCAWKRVPGPGDWPRGFRGRPRAPDGFRQ